MAPNNKVDPNDSKEEVDDNVSNQSSVYSEINKDQNINANQVLNETNNNLIDTDNLDDFLTSRFHTNGIMYELLQDQSYDHCYNFIQITSAGNVAVEVDEEVRYSFKFSGCYMLNNIRSLIG